MRGLIAQSSHLITGPTVNPIDLEEAKKYQRVTTTSEDTIVDMAIEAARLHFEAETGRQLIAATWEDWIEAPPAARTIELLKAPLLEVIGIFYDLDGEEQTLDASSYRVSAPVGAFCRRGSVTLNPGIVWPSITPAQNAIRIRYTAGYGLAPGAVPDIIRLELHRLVGDFYKYRTRVQELDRQTLDPVPLGAELTRAMFRLPDPVQLRGASWV